MRLRITLFVSLCIIVFGAGAAIVAATVSFADFGLIEAKLKSEIVGSLQYGQVSTYPNRKLYSAASPAARASFVKHALAWIKSYTESAAFKADYDSKREAAKPKPDKSKGTPEEQFAQNRAQQHKSLQDFKTNVARMKPEMQSQMASTLKQLEVNVQKWDTDAQFKATMLQMYAQVAVSEQKDFQQRLENFDKRFPADPRQLIAKRLRDFLEVSRDVNFDAQLKPAGSGKMRFADPQYERKSDHWKLCYRAGKEPVEAARAFAGDWLQQLEK